MKGKRHIQSFNEHQENLNISDVSDSVSDRNFKKFSFCRYEGKNIVLLTQQWATAWIANQITKTGLMRPIGHYVFEQDIETKIEPIMNIKNSELERMKVYHQDFVDYYNELKHSH